MQISPRHRRFRTPGVLILTISTVLGLSALSIRSAAAHGHDGADKPKTKPTIVLVHGDWADGSSWNAVTERLIDRGYNVEVPPNPLHGPTEDSAYLKSFLDTIPGQVVLVAHSYGGFVATNAATGSTNVKALVYIDAFIPDQGDRLLDLVPNSCLAADPSKVFRQVPVSGGADLYLQVAASSTYPGFAECFANGVDSETTAVLAVTQRPAFTNQVSETSGPPAWKTIPSWSLIGDQDHVIPADRQEFMSERAGATIEHVDAGHLSLITRPRTVTNLIESAVAATS